MDKNDFFKDLTDLITGLGAYKAAVIPTSDVTTDVSFRTLCEQNVCGNYGKNHMCPPDVGDINELIAKLYGFEYILVYQSVGTLEDSFDFEGMADAAEKHGKLICDVRDTVEPLLVGKSLFLGAGGCRLCPVCAKKTNEPCRHPEKATPSLEAYGVNVSLLAKAAGMKYINGQNTVTYFGAVLFDIDDEKL